MIARNLEPRLRAAATHYPIVTLTGPRQSGKTTLCRQVFADKPYVSLEAQDAREYALRDPRGFLTAHRDGAILDEIQRVPELMSYLQGEVDADRTPGRFVLTGSQHFGLLQSISQSLAGRTAVLHLLPLGWDEVQRFPQAPSDLFQALWTGGYPAIHDRGVPVQDWLSDYVTTYLERDVRQVLNVADLVDFQRYLRLAAGRSAQLFNAAGLAADVGIAANTAKAWLSVLETSFLAWRLPPFFTNVSQRLIKAPKLHLIDSGLLCLLLGIQSPEQLRLHPLRGAIFESWVAAELRKVVAASPQRPGLWFYRDRKGLEADALLQSGPHVTIVETKSGETVPRDAFGVLDKVEQELRKDPTIQATTKVLVYGGEDEQDGERGAVWSWRAVACRAAAPTSVGLDTGR
jgi:predicted AAA+ superfamily ATPase